MRITIAPHAGALHCKAFYARRTVTLGKRRHPQSANVNESAMLNCLETPLRVIAILLRDSVCALVSRPMRRGVEGL
jgi:hypothetical protein